MKSIVLAGGFLITFVMVALAGEHGGSVAAGQTMAGVAENDGGADGNADGVNDGGRIERLADANHHAERKRLTGGEHFAVGKRLAGGGRFSDGKPFPTPRYDTLVVATPDLLPTLGRWIEYRQSQGHQILVIPSQRLAASNRYFIRRVVATHRHIKHLVLVGDAADWTQPATSLLPADHVMAEVNYKFGSEREIATDNTYADLNGDAIPELTVGRIVATDANQLNRYIDRVIDYESPHNDSRWRRRVNLVAGLGGFGSVTDGLIETTAKQIITDKIPASYNTSVTYASWQSPYCPDPRRFSDTAIERFNQGCLFWIYVGHGDRRRLDQVRVPQQRFDILNDQSAATMNCRSGSPIAIFLACYTGALDSSRDCLAEQMIKQPGGPVAVICGSRVTMPYAMGLLSIEMADEFFAGQSPTIGQLMRRSKLGMVSDLPVADDDKYRQMIESMGRSLSPLPEALEAEKHEHLHLVNLLGDPLLRLQRPGQIELQCDSKASAGESLTVNGRSDCDGDLTIELVYRRDRFRNRPRRRRTFDADDKKLADYQNTYRQAHDQVCVSKQLKVTAGAFTTSIEIPADVRGECQIRAMVLASGVGDTIADRDQDGRDQADHDLDGRDLAKRDQAGQRASRPTLPSPVASTHQASFALGSRPIKVAKADRQ